MGPYGEDFISIPPPHSYSSFPMNTQATILLDPFTPISFGGTAGREGPMVQIGAALGSAIGQWARLTARNIRTLVACGAAGGVELRGVGCGATIARPAAGAGSGGAP